MEAFAIRTPTLIPNVDNFALAALVMLTLGSFGLSSHLHARWFSSTAVDLIQVNCLVKGSILAWALWLLPDGKYFMASMTGLIPAIGAGVLGFLVCWRWELWFLRWASRKWRNRPEPRATGGEPTNYVSMKTVLPSGVGRRDRRKQVAGDRVFSKFSTEQAVDIHRFNEFSVACVAVLEEILFRGMLVYVCLVPNSLLLNFLGLSAVSAIFCMSHISFGLRHVIAKIPMAILTLVCVLTTQNVLAPVVLHVIFNLRVVREARSSNKSVGVVDSGPL